jgi:hypothetical protein
MLLGMQPYSFGSARFGSTDLERQFLGWTFNQFLYGEVTGIQCGYWLYRAPHFRAATFLARQAQEELSHVKRMIRILEVLGCPPGPAHPAVRFLTTGMMGSNWGEHVAIEMALGEGLVLSVFRALEQTIDQPEIKKILQSALVEEERHVQFGEMETKEWLQKTPHERKHLLGLVLFQFMALKWLKSFVKKKTLKALPPGHAVLSQFDAFYEHTLKEYEERMMAIGLCSKAFSALSFFEKLDLLLLLPARKLASRLRGKGKLLTDTYLKDSFLKIP